MDVDAFLAQNQRRYEVLPVFEDMINHLAHIDELEAIYQFIEDNQDVFFRDRSSAICVLGIMNIISLFNYKRIELIFDIWIHFQHRFYLLDINDLDVVSIVHNIPALCYLYSQSSIDLESIRYKSSSSPFLFELFYPELKEHHPVYAKEYLSKNAMLVEHKNIELFSKDPADHSRNRSIFYHTHPLHKHIRDDDLESFQNYLSHNKININFCFPRSPYERTYTIDRSPSLIQYAAVYGSLNIFKFLWQQPNISIPDNLISYAFSGRNYEIIHLCETSCDMNNGITFAISSQMDELIEYCIDNFKESSNTENVYDCLNEREMATALSSCKYSIIIPSLKTIVSLIKQQKIQPREVPLYDIELSQFLLSQFTHEDMLLSLPMLFHDIKSLDFLSLELPSLVYVRLLFGVAPYVTPRFIISFLERYKKHLILYPNYCLQIASIHNNDEIIIKVIKILKEDQIDLSEASCHFEITENCFNKIGPLLDENEKAKFRIIAKKQ